MSTTIRADHFISVFLFLLHIKTTFLPEIPLKNIVDKYFWRGFEIFDNISKARNEIFKIHSENTEFIENNFVPILKKYDFYNNYDSSFDVEEKINIGSSPMFSWSYMYSRDIEIRFSTNLLTKELEVDGQVWDRNENFEDWFIKNIIYYKLGNKNFIIGFKNLSKLFFL